MKISLEKWIRGQIIQNKIKRDASYITGGSFSAFLPGGDIFTIFIVFVAIIVIALGFSAFHKKKIASGKMDKRASSLKREFSNVKEKSSYNESDNWIKNRLDDDYDNIDDLIITNKK